MQFRQTGLNNERVMKKVHHNGTERISKSKPTVQEQIAAMTAQCLQALEQRMLGLMVGSMSRAQRQAELAKRKNKKKRKANCMAKEVSIGRRINAASQAFKEYEAVRYLALKELEAR